MRVGSLCSGYGGLDMAACGHFNGTVAWYSEIEPAGVQVLSRHHPKAQDIGDLTRLDWEQLEKVDVVTAGFPCQPVSYAGQQQGTEDTRWLFDDIIKGLGILRPRYILLENVPGLFTADGGDAMASVLHGLSLLGGYDYQWGVVRASDAGAPHKRARWFCLATATTNLGHERGGPARGRRDGSTNGDLGTTPPRAQNAESRNTKPWVRPLDQPQNLENALARLIPELLPTPISRDWKDTGTLEDIPENYILPRTIARLFRTPIAEEDKVRWNPHHLTYQLHLQECSNTGTTPKPSVGGNLSSEDKHQSPSSMDD